MKTLNKQRKPSLWRQMVQNRSAYLFMSGYLLVFLLFTVIPVGAAIVLGFTGSSFSVPEPPPEVPPPGSAVGISKSTPVQANIAAANTNCVKKNIVCLLFVVITRRERHR